jgi:hypothetical protein
MDFYAVLDQAVALLRQRQRVTYRALKVQFQLDDEALEALRDERIEAQHLAADEAGKVLVWTGALAGAESSPAPAPEPVRPPHAYTPPYLAEKILTSRSALAGERKQVTVLFADLKGSMELLADRDPEEARQLLDPVPPASANALLPALLGDDPSLAPLTQLLIARTQGNPFFLEESVRTLVETQVLAGERGAYRLAKALPSIQAPATVQAMLAARIDRLSPEEKQLLQTAAVIGTEVPLSLLQAIAGVPEDAMYRGLAHLQATEFPTRRSSFLNTSTPSSTPSPTKWPMPVSSRSGGERCMPASLRSSRRWPGSA